MVATLFLPVDGEAAAETRSLFKGLLCSYTSSESTFSSQHGASEQVSIRKEVFF